ncbi:MAG: glycoside hydrolase family 15 protein [Kofleriaceae bacterium]|nr:glycoside hydrolase family 15 protein [Kofleriaceae bacterium]
MRSGHEERHGDVAIFGCRSCSPQDVPSAIEDYALIGDMRTVALVGKDGSIDWLCLPSFDAGACFASLLGNEYDGRWLIAPRNGDAHCIRRRYRKDTLVLETEIKTSTGIVRLIDCMPLCTEHPAIVRVVEGVEGRVEMKMQLVMRFDYGWIVPWVRKVDHVLTAVGGPDALALRTPVPTHGENLTTVAEFVVRAGERVPFELSWYRSHLPIPPAIDVDHAIAHATDWWRRWASHCTYEGEWREAVVRSLLTLKALTYTPTGGIIAAPTTSLPECLGGVRNWDYRYAWLRDATFTLYALMLGGFRDEAAAWRDWLLRSVAGDAAQLQIAYSAGGERRLPEQTLPWLSGYASSKPVRIGNAAVTQLQLDVYGEVLDALHHARRNGMQADTFTWQLERKLLEFLEHHWQEPDEGLWEVRGTRQQFTHSKLMAWVAFDRAVRTVEEWGTRGPVERWRHLRDTIHAEICAKAYDTQRGTFTQAYGSPKLDASLLLIPIVGFLPQHDPRVVGTVEAIARDLVHEDLVIRYRTEDEEDGLPPGEGVFLLCSFWLADNYALMGRTREARALFERLLSLRNDVGLLSEEYDPVGRRMLGNFPQAFSHVGLINTAYNLTPSQVSPGTARKCTLPPQH